MYDLIVLGAGPGGYEAAAHAGEQGLKTALVEKQWLGGTCLNAGCIPTKSMLYAVKLLRECRQAAAFGVNTGEVSFDYAFIQMRKQKTVAALVKGVQAKLKRAHVEVIEAAGKLLAPGRVAAGNQELTARQILIASGARAALPPVPGIDLPHVVDAGALLEQPTPPRALVVIGAGVIGLEMAVLCRGLGAAVTVVELLPRIACSMDREFSGYLKRMLEREGIVFHLSSRVTRIGDSHVVFTDADGKELQAECDTVLNATGRLPNTENLGLEEAGVWFDKRGIAVDERGRTNIPGIWACGDVTGRCLLAHAATREGIVAVNNICGKPDVMRYGAVPSVIYTQPEAAWVGMTEQELEDKQLGYKKSVVPLSVSGRFMAEHGQGTGYVKVLAGQTYGELLGVHILGGPAGELIYGAAALLEMEMTAQAAREIVFPHPTVSEALLEAIRQIN